MKVEKSFKFTSSAFSHNGRMPEKYTCDGINISPSLSWSGAPEGVKSYALICDDPDAPKGTWVHWVVYNIPPDVRELREGASSGHMPTGCSQGVTDFGKTGFGGACPPQGHGVHHYHFKLYALDRVLELAPGATKEQLETMMEGHIRARAEIVGLYERK